MTSNMFPLESMDSGFNSDQKNVFYVLKYIFLKTISLKNISTLYEFNKFPARLLKEKLWIYTCFFHAHTNKISIFIQLY